MNLNPSLSVLGRKIAFSTFVQYAGKLVQLVLAAMTVKMISGFLNEQQYSVYSLIGEYTLFFSTVANLGIFGNVVKRMADTPKDRNLFINALMLRVGSALLFFIFGMVTLVATKNEFAFLLGSALFFGSLLFDYVTSVCDGMLQANYMMGRAMIASVIGRVIHTGVVFLLVKGYFLEANYALLFLAPLIGSAVSMLLTFIFSWKELEGDWHFDKNFMVKIFWLSLPFGIINIFNNLYFRFLPDYFANMHLSPEQFSGFSVSFRMAQVLSLASTFLMFSVLPGLKQYIDQKHFEKARKLLRTIMWMMAGLGILIVVAGSLSQLFLVDLLTDKKYFLPDFPFMFPMMLILAAISYGYDVILLSLFALDEDKWLLKREAMAVCLAGAFFILSIGMFSPQSKIVCVLLGALLGETFMVVSGYVKLKRTLLQRHADHHTM